MLLDVFKLVVLVRIFVIRVDHNQLYKDSDQRKIGLSKETKGSAKTYRSDKRERMKRG